ncbi:MAG TPA: hypothetical protein VFV73_04340 [Streptosporangiaceae bacterium]|nr:hypothetical protein [Streptosporangiaceae bacterium]
MRRLWIVLTAAGTLAACSSPAATTPARTSASAPATTRATAAATPSPSPTPTPAPPAPRVTLSTMRVKDGSRVTVAVFSGPVTFVLHDGSEDPGLAAGRVKAGPVVRGAERGQLLAAFNGGFKLSAGAGGYEQEGHVAAALRRGLASLVIDRSGRARIGVWGHGAPGRGEAVYSVRQNLTPLVLNGKPTPAAADWSVWGATLGGGEFVARSALGQGADGDLEYAASMSASPADLAVALTRAGARVAMELDINPEWIQLDVARRPGGPLRAAIKGQARPANQFLEGWARDFVTVLGQ